MNKYHVYLIGKDIPVTVVARDYAMNGDHFFFGNGTPSENYKDPIAQAKVKHVSLIIKVNSNNE